MDEYSDLDLVIGVYPEQERAVSLERMAIAERCGRLLAAFTGEHVGEPRLLICLYGPPLLHVDLKFSTGFLWSRELVSKNKQRPNSAPKQEASCSADEV